MASSTPKSLLFKGWKAVREAGIRRLVLTGLLLLAALFLSRFSWDLPEIMGEWSATPVVGQGERTLYDARVNYLAKQVDQDERIVMVVYNDLTLINARKRSPLDRGLLAQALRNIDEMGAKAIGIDILFDQPQDEDAELIETLRAMKTPVLIGYAEMDINAGDIQYEQQLYLEDFLAQLEGSNARPSSIMLSDADGVTRLFPPIRPELPDPLARAMLMDAGEGDKSMAGYEGAIRYKLPAYVDLPVFTSVPIDTYAIPDLMAIPPLVEETVPLVEGRYVLIGGDIVDYDRVETPFTSVDEREPPGLEIHATMLAQMLDGAELSKPSSAYLWLQALLVVLAAGMTALLEVKSWKFIPLVLGQLVLFLGLPFWLHAQGVDTYGFPAAGPVLGWVLAFVAVVSAARASGAEQRRFAQGALGKYLPREMAQEIINNPELLSLHGEKKQIFVLFSDLEGFTKMSHAIEPEMVAKLLNRYLEVLSQVVLDHGGVIDKFVGDAVVAFWGAPLSREDDGERAAKAGYAMWQAGEDFRKEVAAMGDDLPPVGKTRVGLHWGEAVVGNFGGETRIQYTALGDSMNTAARLESANKALESSVMASREFAERSGLDWWRPMGRVVLRGRSKPVDLMEPTPDFPDEDRKILTKIIALVESDSKNAAKDLADLIVRYPEDTALANLARRLGELEENNAFILG